MTVGYIPVSQRSSRRSNSTDRDLESNISEPQKPFRMSVGQRQLVGMMVFVWFICLWVGLKIMEAAQYSHRSPLLPTTNALLDTPDLYHTLTVPLLDLVNRTQLISTRCGATTLEPHLLSFLTNDLAGSPSLTTSTSTTTTSSSNDDTLVDTTTTTAEQSAAGAEVEKRTRPYRYLFALILQDSETILPDVLTRILETISILGPDNCHLSVVNHASTDATKEMLHLLKEFLDMYNRGDIQMLGSLTSSSVEKRADGVDPKVERGVRGGQDKEGKKGKDEKKQRKQYMSYTITTMTARDTSVENVARIKDLALDPLLAAASTSTDIVTTGSSDEDSANGVAFDRIVLMDPVVTCAEDLLELIFQSLLQDADVTCGMDLGYLSSKDDGGVAAAASDEAGDTVADPGKLQDGVYDSTVTRDMLHQKLHRDTSTNNQISNDATTQTRFTKRVPFQVESCWSRAVVLKTATAIKVSGLASGKPILFSEVIEKQTRLEAVGAGVVEGQCATTPVLKDGRALFCNALWGTANSVPPSGSSVTNTTPPPPRPSPATVDIIRMVLVPTIQFTDSPKEYVLQGKFNGWGVWPKTEKQFRDGLEARLVSVSHRPLYGYRPSTSSYGYIPRVQEEADGEDSASGVSSFLEVVFSKEGKGEGESDGQEQEQEEKEKEKEKEKETRRQEEERMISAIVPVETVEGLKARLEAVGAVFGVQDIQNAVLTKRDSDLITEWRPRFVEADDALPGSIDC